MDQIRAFVGHSFLDADADVVRKFTNFFDRIVELGIGFSWDHAEKAEPHELREKVLGKIKGKNVFIGICTQNEAAISLANLKSAWFLKSKYIVQQGHIAPKTSDWIIQEIGLAIGLGMELVLLVEKGLRQPGGLQGNIERIEFTRDHPEESHTKILEMIHALRPKVKPVQSIEAPVPSEEEPKVGEQSDEGLLTPKAEWDQSDYERALRISILQDNKDAEIRVYEAYKQSALATNKESVALLEGIREYMHIFLGTGEDLNAIKKLCSQYPNLNQLQFYLGRCYAIYKEPLSAAKSFEEAARLTDDLAKKNEYLGYAAKSYKDAGEHKEKNRVLSVLWGQPCTTVSEEVRSLEAVLSAIENEGGDDLVVGCYEALASLKPDDTTNRFRVAHKYSEIGRQDLALFHYSAIPYAKRGGGTWNNIGIAYSNQKMPIRSVRSYKEAVKENETLAMSNLARQYLDAGFIEEAEALCQSATKIENYDKHIGSTISRIKEADEEESQKVEKIFSNIKESRDYYREYGMAAIRNIKGRVDGRWQSRRCELVIKVDGNKIHIVGQYEVGPSALGLLIAKNFTGGAAGAYQSPPQPTKYEICYEGTLFGATAYCEYSIDEIGAQKKQKSLLTDAASKKTALMIFCSDGNTIRVLEKKDTDGFLTEDWNRI